MSKIDPRALVAGTKQEMKEHGLDEKTARRIAKDHLSERSDYYKVLSNPKSQNIRTWLDGHTFKKQYAIADGWGLWISNNVRPEILYRKPEIKWYLVGLVAHPIIDEDQVPAPEIRSNSEIDGPFAADIPLRALHEASRLLAEIWDKVGLAADREAGVERRGHGSWHRAFQNWFKEYYLNTFGIKSVWPEFSKDLLEHVAIELDQALEKGRPVNGDLLLYIRNATK